MAQLSREAQNVNWLVSSFVRRVPGIAHAIVVTSDALREARQPGGDRARADQLAAVASGLASLTQGASRCFGGGKVNQTAVEMEQGFLLVMSIGDGSALAALAAPSVDIGLAGYGGALLAGDLRGEARVGVGEQFLVPDAQRADPALLAAGEGDEVAQLDDLRLGEVAVQALPEGVVGQVGVPGDRLGVGQRGALALVEAVGGLEVQQLVVVALVDALLRALQGALAAAVLAVHRPRHVQAAELLDAVVEHAVAERGPPRGGEGAQQLGDVRADRLALRAWRAVAPRVLHDLHELRIVEAGGVDVADSLHGFLLDSRVHCGCQDTSAGVGIVGSSDSGDGAALVVIRAGRAGAWRCPRRSSVGGRRPAPWSPAPAPLRARSPGRRRGRRACRCRTAADRPRRSRARTRSRGGLPTARCRRRSA